MLLFTTSKLRQATAQMAPSSHVTANGGNLSCERELRLLEFAHCMHRNDSLCFVDILMPPEYASAHENDN
jgi:hypothetical protein